MKRDELPAEGQNPSAHRAAQPRGTEIEALCKIFSRTVYDMAMALVFGFLTSFVAI
jgi:hypothetical protein